MMVRDTVDGLVLDWFKTAKSRVINPDGTGNIPSKYLLNVRIYRLLSSGLTKLENEMTVFPVTTGDVTYARDQVTEFKSFPMTFALHSTFNQSSSSLASFWALVFLFELRSKDAFTLFPLPSRPTELIQFRQPNIADAMRFNSITLEEQEQQTTAYLKALLAEPAKHDP